MATKVQPISSGSSSFNEIYSLIPVSSQVNQQDKLIPLSVLMDLTTMSRSWIYDAVSKKIFPQPIKLGKRSVAWLYSEVLAWMQQQVQASRPAVKVVETSPKVSKAQASRCAVRAATHGAGQRTSPTGQTVDSLRLSHVCEVFGHTYGGVE